jgi:hypothetical protein
MDLVEEIGDLLDLVDDDGLPLGSSREAHRLALLTQKRRSCQEAPVLVGKEQVIARGSRKRAAKKRGFAGLPGTPKEGRSALYRIE